MVFNNIRKDYHSQERLSANKTQTEQKSQKVLRNECVLAKQCLSDSQIVTFYIRHENEGKTPLHKGSQLYKEKNLETAIELKSMDLLVELIENGDNINQRRYNQGSLVMYAVTNCYNEGLAVLLTNGADATLSNNDGDTALHLIDNHRGDPEMIDMLVAHGADINAKNKKGYTPLEVAISTKNNQILSKLIANGADIPTNFYDKKGQLKDCYPPYFNATTIKSLLNKAKTTALLLTKLKITTQHCAIPAQNQPVNER